MTIQLAKEERKATRAGSESADLARPAFCATLDDLAGPRTVSLASKFRENLIEADAKTKFVGNIKASRFFTSHFNSQPRVNHHE
jgi:hypothetical protein